MLCMQAKTANRNKSMSDNSYRQRFQAFLKTDRAILMACISIAFVFWLMTKMSYPYRSTFRIPLDYETPKGKVLVDRVPTSLNVEVEGTGWTLFRIYFSDREDSLNLDLENRSVQSFNTYTLQNLLKERFLPANISSMRPDAIESIKLEDTASKVIPILLDDQITLAPQTQLKDSISIKPKRVRIKGPASIVRDINEWPTVPLILQNVERSKVIELRLQEHPSPSVVFDPQSVQCEIDVEQITEKSFKLSVEVLNVPDSLLLVVLPRQINITVVVGLSDYEQLGPEDFRAVVDFKDFPIFEKKNIRIDLRKRPDYVQRISYRPRKLDYIIRSAE